MRRVGRMMGDMARTRGIELEVHVDADLPRLRADERLIRQVLLNLVSNAVKFTEPDGRVEVVGRRAADGRLELGVADTGVGVERRDLVRAMEQFVQINDRSHQVETRQETA